MSPKTFFFLLSATLVLLLAGGGYVYYLASSQLYNQTGSYAKKLADLQISQDRIEQIQNLKSQMKKLEQEGDINLILTALPATYQQAELTLQLQRIANQSGMTISEISFPIEAVSPTKTNAKKAKEEVTSYLATFNLDGTYDKLQNFLQLQENLNRYTNVINLGISKDEKDRNLTFKITLNAYVKP